MDSQVPYSIRNNPVLVDRILVNFGANDAQFLPGGGWTPEIVQETWIAQYLVILDELHARFPTAHIWLMRPWRRDLPTQCATLAGWIGDVQAARPAFVSLGPDEAVWLENGDNGILETDAGGVHYTALGNQLCAEAWASWWGY